MGKRAVVLAGGGSRGAYQIGVWRALREMGIDYQIVTGASVGALNGAMMVLGDYDAAKKLWETIQTKDVLDFDIPPEQADYSKPGWELDVWMAFAKKAAASGGAGFAPLEAAIGRLVDEERLRAAGIGFGLVTVEFPSMKAAELTVEQIPKGQLKDFLLASAACFPAMKSKQISGTRYIDGGYHDNMPVNLALSMGAEEVLAVDLHGFGKVRKPQKDDVPIRYIRSYWNLGPFLWFEPGLSRKNMALGYLDTLRAYGLAEGTAYAFKPASAKQLAKLLTGPVRELLGKAGYFEEKNPAAAVGLQTARHAARLRCQRVLRKHQGSLRSMEDFFLAAAEIAGEQLNLDPTQIYTVGSFHAALLEAFAPVEKLAEKAAGRLREVRVPLRELADQALREGHLYAVSLCYDMISRAVNDAIQPWMWNLGALLPEGFLAALYLYLLRHTELYGLPLR